ncbi:MAG: hypothetical protein PVF74_13170, partial [Anaerolineales bacterium]
MSNMRFRPITLLVAFILVFGLILTACQPAATEEPAAEEPAAEEPAAEEPAAEEPAEVEAGSVGIVLPTKEEPRWIQDETRFREAFDAA